MRSYVRALYQLHTEKQIDMKVLESQLNVVFEDAYELNTNLGTLLATDRVPLAPAWSQVTCAQAIPNYQHVFRTEEAAQSSGSAVLQLQVVDRNLSEINLFGTERTTK